MSADAKEYLKDILSKINGYDPSTLEFKNLRNRKKKKNNDINLLENKNGDITVNNNEGMVLTGMSSKTVEWGDIRGKKRHEIRDNIEEWTAYDFYYYTKQLYDKKFASGWNLKIGGAIRIINKLKDKLMDYIGFSSNLVAKDYVSFFFNHYISNFKNGKDGFYFSQFLLDYILQDFINTYDYRKSHIRYINSKSKKNTSSISFEEIKKSYQLSINTLLCNFGLVVSLNWLIHVEKIDKYKAADIISNACRYLKEKDMITTLKNVTEFFSPYPSWFIFKKPNDFIKKIDPNIDINVIFVDNNCKFDCLNIKEK